MSFVESQTASSCGLRFPTDAFIYKKIQEIWTYKISGTNSLEWIFVASIHFLFERNGKTYTGFSWTRVENFYVKYTFTV